MKEVKKEEKGRSDKNREIFYFLVKQVRYQQKEEEKNLKF